MCCDSWGHKESDTTERLHFHSSLSCIGEGNGNPLQCSCLENPRDGGAWWAAVSGVAQSRTRLKRLSSSSSSNPLLSFNSIPINSAKEIIAKARSLFGALGITQILLLCQDFLNLCLLLSSGFPPCSPPTPKLPGTSKFLLPGPTAL